MGKYVIKQVRQNVNCRIYMMGMQAFTEKFFQLFGVLESFIIKCWEKFNWNLPLLPPKKQKQQERIQESNPAALI